MLPLDSDAPGGEHKVNVEIPPVAITRWGVERPRHRHPVRGPEVVGVGLGHGELRATGEHVGDSRHDGSCHARIFATLCPHSTVCQFPRSGPAWPRPSTSSAFRV